MMLEYTKVLLQYLWKNIALLLVFNLVVFRLMAKSDGMVILSNDDDQMLSILTIFALENFVYAMWLQWSPHQTNFWRQITASEAHLQGLHFTLFFAVSAATQLLPVFSYLALQSDPAVHVTLLDYAGYLYIWGIALLAYGAGVIVSWWRKWSMMLILLLLPFFWDVIFANLFMQIAALMLIALAMISFVFLQERQRTLLISVALSFATYEMILIFTQGILVKRENVYEVPEQIVEQFDAKNGVQLIHRQHVPLFDFPGVPSLVDDTNGLVDWLTGEVQIPEALLKDLRIKQKLEADIKTLWQKHRYQKPKLELINSDQVALFFKNGIYISDTSGNLQAVWSGPADEPIVWYEIVGETKANDYNHGELFVNTDKLIVALADRILVFAGSGQFKRVQTLQLTAPILVAEQQKIIKDQKQFHRLMLLTADDNLLLYEAETGAAPYSLSEQINTEKDLKTLILRLNMAERSVISSLHTQFRWYSWRSLYPDVLFAISPWLLLSQFLALMCCVVLYKQDDKSLLLQKGLLVALFSWPLLITLLFCMPRKKAAPSRTQP